MHLAHVSPVIPTLLLCTLTGCSAFQKNRAPTTTKQPAPAAVQAFNVTQIPEENARHVMAYPTGDKRTSSLLIEQVSPAEVRVGRELTYQIKITNLTNDPVRGILLRSRPLDGMRVLGSSAATRPIGDGQIVYDVGDLGPREFTTVDVRTIPDRLGKLESAYIVSTRPPILHTALNVVQPILKVSATGPADIDICQDIVHRYTVTNAGTGVARHVTLQAALPDGLTTADGKPIVSAALGDIPEGASRDVTAYLKATRTGRFSTQAVARSRDDAARAEPVVTAAHAPNLTLAVRGPDQEQAGKPVVYTVTVTNNGDAPARQTTLKLAPSAIGQIASVRADTDAGPGEPQLASAVVDVTTNSLGTIPPGQSRRIEVTATTLDGGTLSLDATATATCAPEAKLAARTRILTVPALALQVADELDPAPVGQDVTYTVTVTNAGTGSDTNVRVTATLPDNLTYVRSTGPTESRAAANTVTFSPIPRLAPKESATWRLTARALRPGDAQLRTSATSDSLKTPSQKSEPTRLY
jgi:uncharacterized repeat protein (TIGR01451 family)